MLKVSLDSSWLKDSARMEAPCFPEPDGAEIRKNRKTVFDTYFLCPNNLVQQKVVLHRMEIGVRSQVNWQISWTDRKLKNTVLTFFEFLKTLSFGL